jgi:hypothetical protein
MSEKTELQKNEGIDRLRKVRGKDRVTNQSDTEVLKYEGIDRLRKVRGKDRVTNQSDTEVFNNEQLEKDYSKTRQKKQPFFLKEEEGTDDLIADAAKKTRREIKFKSEILREDKS